MLRLHAHGLKPVEQLRCDMDRMISDVFGARDEMLPQIGGRRGNPALDIWEENDDFFVAAEVPGVADSDATVTTIGRELTLEGKWAAIDDGAERSEENETDGLTHHFRERRRGSFHRVVRFPFDIDVENVEASLASGVLTIRVPKAASAKPRRIELKGS